MPCLHILQPALAVLRVCGEACDAAVGAWACGGVKAGIAITPPAGCRIEAIGRGEVLEGLLARVESA